MVIQCIELLEYAYKKFLNSLFTLNDVIIGDSCGEDKVSFHLMIYDGQKAWDTGYAKEKPFNSSQKHFVSLLRNETLRNPEK